MTAENNNKTLTVASCFGILLLAVYFLDSIFGTGNIASAPVDAERAEERKSARIEIDASAESAKDAIEAAKAVVLKEWGDDPHNGYKAFMAKVEAKYPTPEVDEALGEFE